MSQSSIVRVSTADDILSTEVDGEAVLLNARTGQYYSLNDVGTRMWTLLAQHGDLEAVVQAMLDEYEVDEEELRQDVLHLVQELAGHGLLTVHER